MNRAYDSKRKPKLEADKVRNSPNLEKTNRPSTKNKKTLFATAQMLNTVSPSCLVCLLDQNPGVS